ncbi:phosphotransferase [Acidothermaceae bacterium B102]|nr:phosphotransferase [Acidothermaceae bacterium B102]
MADAVHDLSGGGDVLVRLHNVAERALGSYDVAPGSTVSLINVSENATYRVDQPDGPSLILRLHRLGYHSRDAIASELAWLAAVATDTGIRTPVVVPARDGEQVIAVTDEGRHAVMFELLPGAEPSEDHLVRDFEPLGALTARLHEHAVQWQQPARFTRFAWDYDAAFGTQPRWGRWADGVGVGAQEREVLGRLDTTIRQRLQAYGQGRDRFGLIHADLRLANLLVDGASTAVIDFDDCGTGWFLYDVGAAVSFMEHYPQVPEMIDAWQRGYRTVRPLSQADEDEIWTFVLFRRLLLVAWIGSHSAAEIAQELGAGYTAGSCELAEAYLSTHA